MLKTGVIEVCNDVEWSSNVVLADKKGGEKRLCIDYRQLNAIAKKDLWPIVRIDDALDSLYGLPFLRRLIWRQGIGRFY